MNRVINPLYIGSSGGGLVPTIRVYAPVGSSVSCDGQTKVVGADGFVDFVVSAEPVNILPDGVQGLESIASNGTQYIKTGILTSGDTVITMDASMQSYSADRMYVGYYGSTGSLCLQTSGSNLYEYFNSNSSYKRASSSPNRRLYEIGKDFRIDGTLIGSFSASTFTGQEIYVFGANGYTNYMGSMTLYESFLYKALGLVRRFIPCIYNNSVGMWDVVSNSFFGNQGTGAFIAGEPKEWLDFPTYTVTVGGASQMVKVDKVGLFPVSFN